MKNRAKIGPILNVRLLKMMPITQINKKIRMNGKRSPAMVIVVTSTKAANIGID